MTRADDLPLMRICGPADLLQSVPYLLGFRPVGSLVLVGLSGGRLTVTSRMDVGDIADDRMLRHALRGLCNGGATEVVAAVYDDSARPDGGSRPWRGLATHLEGLCRSAGVDIIEALLVCRDRWWSLLCDDLSCCPAEGSALPESPSPYVAAATVAGRVAFADREALAALLTPAPDDEREALRGLLAEAEHGMPAGGTPAAMRWARARGNDLRRAARAADRGTVDLPGETLAGFGAALRRTAVRDDVWSAADAGRFDGRDLWRDLARRLPGPYDAAPLFLYAWTSWRQGDGALANIACERVLASDPGYSAADLLLAALSQAVDPRRLPPMRVPRGGVRVLDGERPPT